jgi:hypothetical protein
MARRSPAQAQWFALLAARLDRCNSGGVPIKSGHYQTCAKLDSKTHQVNIRKITPFKVKIDPIQSVGKLEDKLTEFIHANGDYLFMAFAFLCLLAIAWLLLRQRKSPPPEPSSARTRAIIGTMLASPDMSSDADGGRARSIMGKSPSQKASDSN